MRRFTTACTVLALGASLLVGGLAPGAAAAAAPGAVTALRAPTPPSSVPDLDAPGPARTVEFPPDGRVRSSPGHVSIQAPEYTRIVRVDPWCSGMSCPVSIASDGSSAGFSLQSNNWVWSRPFRVDVVATDDAPMAGGRFTGTLTLEGVVVEWTVNITEGTPGAFGGYVSNVPGGGGARVRFVDPDLNAAAAGFMDKDVITSVDGRPVTSAASLNAALADKRAGTAVPVGITRNGTQMTLQYRVDE
ncbi:PDZ domain-containing protein [Streptomyces sp. NPDC090306]|uniref:PDZ domain-containing protein n=1 Tax=Streptomyces sp. NPDC090306 TaxID=3365961 RepID=UPI00381EE8C9